MKSEQCAVLKSVCGNKRVRCCDPPLTEVTEQNETDTIHRYKTTISVTGCLFWLRCVLLVLELGGGDICRVLVSSAHISSSLCVNCYTINETTTDTFNLICVTSNTTRDHKIQSLVYTFIWGGKRPRLKRQPSDVSEEMVSQSLIFSYNILVLKQLT